MEKEALLNIIINDLKEVDLLMNTFKNLNSIDPEFLQLSMSKIHQITIEMKMLEKFVSKVERQYQNTTITTNVEDEPVVPIVSDGVIVENEVAEASKLKADLVEDKVVDAVESLAVVEPEISQPDIILLETIEPEFVEPELAKVEVVAENIVEPDIYHPKQQILEEELLLVVDEHEIDDAVEVVEEGAKPEIIESAVVDNYLEPAKVEIIKEDSIAIKQGDTVAIQEELIIEKPQFIEPRAEVKTDKSRLKDLLGTATKSVNEIMSEKKPLPTGVGANIVVPVANIYKAIGINDKMLFQRELFANNGAKMNSTIDQLNEMKSFDDALSFLKSNYEWDFESERTNNFLNIIKRRYI